MDKAITAFGKLSKHELIKSLRDVVVEWSIALIPLVFDLVYQVIDKVEVYALNQETLIWMAAAKLVAPFLKRQLNIWRVKTTV